MRKKDKLLMEINQMRSELEKSYVQNHMVEECYEKSLQLDQLLEEYLELENEDS